MQLDAEQLITVLAEKIGNTTPDIGVVGIHTGGVWVADKLAAKIGATRVGRVAVTLHRAALNELFDFGRPASVKLAVLVDRGGRELPVQADYIAITMPLAGSQKLELTNTGGALRFEILEG